MGYTNLDKFMKQNGFKLVKYPTTVDGEHIMQEWYVKKKVPYSSAISKAMLIYILEAYDE